MLAAIWAQDEQGVIGKEGKLPWHLPKRLEIFQGKNNS
nr:Dihydrofolate reductase [uncultured bacterium]